MNPDDLDLVTGVLTCALLVHKLFAGEGAIGLAMLKGFCQGEPQTVESVAAELQNLYSTDTVARKLRHLTDEGLLLRERRGRSYVFRMRARTAESALGLMRGQNLNRG